MRSRRWPYILLGVVVSVPCLLLGIGLTVVKSGFSREAEELPKELTAARSVGMATDADELRASLKIDADANAAELYRAAFKLIEKIEYPRSFNRRTNSIANLQSTPADDAAMRKVLDANSPVLDLLVKASQRPSIDWQRHWEDGAALVFPEMATLRDGAKLLCDAAVLATKEGDHERAFRFLGAVAKMANHAGREPVIISKLVSYSIEGYLANALISCLALNHDAAQLGRARTLLGGMQPVPNISEGFVGELVMIRYAIRGMKNPETAESDGFTLGTLERFLVKDPNYRKAWEAKMVRYQTASFIAAQKAKTWKELRSALVSSEERVMADQSLTNRMNQVFFPVVVNAGDAWAAATANRRILVSAVEVYAAREATGKVPARVPNLGENSLDPFDLKPLRLIPKGQGFTVYSVGADLKDDRGLTKAAGAKSSSPTHDIARTFK